MDQGITGRSSENDGIYKIVLCLWCGAVHTRARQAAQVSRCGPVTVTQSVEPYGCPDTETIYTSVYRGCLQVHTPGSRSRLCMRDWTTYVYKGDNSASKRAAAIRFPQARVS